MANITSWLAIVLGANPHHNIDAIEQVEYQPMGGTGQRKFYGRYKERGPYARQPVANAGLTWNGKPITWKGDPLTWDE
jgi:hypothetical protein